MYLLNEDLNSKSQILATLHKWKKIIPSIGSMVFKSTSSKSWFSRINQFWKYASGSNVSKISLTNQTSKIWQLLDYILVFCVFFCIETMSFSLTIQFHEPYNPNKLSDYPEYQFLIFEFSLSLNVAFTIYKIKFYK